MGVAVSTHLMRVAGAAEACEAGTHWAEVRLLV